MSLKNLSVKIKIPKILINKLRIKKINQIYKKFEKTLKTRENFIVAVSGGPDSLALAFLAKIYSIKYNLSIKFLIVDHNLRPESKREAKFVQKLLKKYFINSQILTIKGKKASKNIQSYARTERYKLLFKQCDKFKIKNILLGHHQDDLFENFFIRILRGSGLKGLVSLDYQTMVENKNLIRPLLHQKKEDLILISKKVFNFYVKDPSNEDEKYKRIKIRKLIKELQKDGLDKKKFFKTIENLKYSDSVISFYVKQNLRKNTFFYKQKRELILNNIFFQQPYEVILRAFSESIKLVGRKYYPVRGKKIDQILNSIEKKQFIKATLGGCIIEKINQTVIISPEK